MTEKKKKLKSLPFIIIFFGEFNCAITIGGSTVTLKQLSYSPKHALCAKKHKPWEKFKILVLEGNRDAEWSPTWSPGIQEPACEKVENAAAPYLVNC